MIYGAGIDIVKIERIKKISLKWGEKFYKRVFLREELSYAFMFQGEKRWQALSARFAAKEAFYKALGTGIGKVGGLRDVSVEREENGMPRISLSYKLQRRIDALGIQAIHLSMSHEREYAVSFVLLES